MTYSVRIDKDICMGSGVCASDYADAFRLDEDELAEPIDDAAALSLAKLRSAARTCPSGAIELLHNGIPLPY